MDLQTPVQYVKGVGPRIAALLARLNIRTVRDLLWYLPFRYIDRRRIDPIAVTEPGRDRVVIGEVVAAGVGFLGRRRTRVYEIRVGDPTGVVLARWFHFHPAAMARFRKGVRVLLAGELTAFGRTRQFIHPETEILEAGGEAEVGGRLLPIYPSTEGLPQRLLRRIIREAWERMRGTITDTLPPAIRQSYQLEPVPQAITALHFPPAEADLDLLNTRRSPAHRTLIFEECFYLELGLLLRRATDRAAVGISMPARSEMMAAFRNTLPFALTGAQERLCAEVAADVSRPRPMHRLIQGDVGSGKTVVAVAAALQAIAAGYQVAFMAPTEILAEQHAQTIAPWMERLRIDWACLTGATKGKSRRAIYERAVAGDLPLLIGTHALIETAVQFARLGLVIVDEQHRFGVAQRLALKQKGEVTHDAQRTTQDVCSPHLLVMTATPIPRTLAMTLYGDLDVSILDELPAGRRPVITKLYTDGERGKLYAGMREALAKGRQIYVVYPLVAESEKIDLKNATDMARALAETFGPPYRVALLHGRMKGEEKEAIMRAFTSGAVHILAATSVVEVGVDVPNAAVMVVEHAERFGLSQLHQLRGRVGRGTHQSYCILVAHTHQSEAARARLAIMEETTDGFRIAEEDLKIRGPGEFLGTRQSGMPELKIANLVTDVGLIEAARTAAVQFVADDPCVSRPESASVRTEVLARWGERLALGKVG